MRERAGGAAAGSSRALDGLRRHWLFGLLLACGLGLRALTLRAYQPALEFHQDSFSYLYEAQHLGPDLVRPIGYPLFLRLMSYGHHLTLVAVVQHGLVLAAAVLLYALLRRLSVPPWLAALATLPALLDGYQVYLESFVLAEALFEFLLVAGLSLLVRAARPGALASAAGGTLLAAACLTRTTGIFVLVPVLVYLAVQRVGAVRLAATVGAAAVVLGGYAVWFRAGTGHLALERYDGYFLAGRVEPFADCQGLQLPPVEQPLCDSTPPALRLSTDWYVWNARAPLRRPDVPAGTDRNAVAADFARRILLHQPGPYLKQTVHDVVHYFAPGRRTGRKDFGVESWQFLTTSTPDPWTPITPPANYYVGFWTSPGPHTQHQVKVGNQGFNNTQVSPHLNPRSARLLRSYQEYGYTPGPLLGLCILLALLGSVGRLSGAAERQLRAVALLLAAAGLFVLLAPAMTAVFDYRYLLPTLLLLPPAGVLGICLLGRRLQERRGASRPASEAR